MCRGYGCGCSGGHGRGLRGRKRRGGVGECLLRGEGRRGDKRRGGGEGGAWASERGGGHEGGERREVHRGGARKLLLRHGVVLAKRGEDGRREGRRARGVRCRRRDQ
jgi:hypothetical protein